MEDKTGSFFCVMEEDTRNTNGWHNLVPSAQFSKQSFLLYRRLVFGQARPTNRLRYGQTASRASIQLLQLTPRALLLNKHKKSANIKLGWITAHVGYSANEATDVLAKKAKQEGIPTYIPAPRNHIKSLLQKEPIIRCKKNGTMDKQARVLTTFCLKSRQLILHVKGHK
ncbi:hypothetical protein AVEN_92242-1 [Araneus ventricosus]|uniref:RNase H type-1 domain-containing protein n=1 Tax=Araneus ventricosus TaxID=182803 RepID=A0A4Y2AM56_ARAVE|nr:hypothetical protein AVEN_92242-1 [Araneus ventricosus]